MIIDYLISRMVVNLVYNNIVGLTRSQIDCVLLSNVVECIRCHRTTRVWLDSIENGVNPIYYILFSYSGVRPCITTAP